MSVPIGDSEGVAESNRSPASTKREIVRPPGSLLQKLKLFLGLPDMPHERCVISNLSQIDTANETLTIRSGDTRIIFQASVREILGARFSPVLGKTGEIDLIVLRKAPDTNAIRSKLEVYAGTFKPDTQPFELAYAFLLNHNFVYDARRLANLTR